MGTSQGPRQFDAYVLSYVPPGISPRAIGILLFDPPTDALHWRVPEDWDFVTDDFDREYLELLSADLAVKVEDMGGGQLLLYLQDTLSNVLRLSQPVVIEGVTPASALETAFIRYAGNGSRSNDLRSTEPA